ncbi:MAG: recombinase family protein [Candidatus Omnitrophica bacterium]|nr:recombinase family protein [Candidatus Omnitrophota bacterium]
MNVVLYARVSSEKQAENDLSIASQLKALRNYAGKNGWTIYKEFVDEAESARSANRPAFQEMIAYAKKKTKPFDGILIWKHSRFARNREDAIIYKSLLRKLGVSVISMNEPVDDSPAGKLLEGIIEVIDEFYSLNLAEDTVRGLRENATRGFQNGSIPAGYKAKNVMDGTNERTKLEPDGNFAPVIERIFALALKNMGIKQIANTLNGEGVTTRSGKPWANSTVKYVLKNEAYTGTLVYGKMSKHKNGHNGTNNNVIRIENNHPALVKKRTFDLVQRLMSKRSSAVIHPWSVASDYLLSGLVICGKCGAKMIGASAKSGEHHYYACSSYLKKGKHICDMKAVNRKELEILVVDRLKTLVLTEKNMMEIFDLVLDQINNNKARHGIELKNIEDQLAGLRERLGKLYNSLETGKIELDHLAPRIKELKTQIDVLEAKRNEITGEDQSTARLPFNLKALYEFAKDLIEILKDGTIMEQKAILRSFVKQIIISPPDVTLEYTVPLLEEKEIGRTTETAVLPMLQIGSLARTRT